MSSQFPPGNPHESQLTPHYQPPAMDPTAPPAPPAPLPPMPNAQQPTYDPNLNLNHPTQQPHQVPQQAPNLGYANQVAPANQPAPVNQAPQQPVPPMPSPAPAVPEPIHAEATPPPIENPSITPTRAQPPEPLQPPTPKPDAFLPVSPGSIEETGLQRYDVESLILKALNSSGASSSRLLSEQTKLPGGLVRQILDELRNELLVVHRGTADLVDYVFQLTEEGTKRCETFSEVDNYCGAAPVPLDAYVESVRAQSVNQRTVNLDDFRSALAGLYLPPEVQSQLAQAVNAGRGLFLYGLPGNGKTAVAERLIACYPDHIWVPRAIAIGGAIMRLFDPSVHKEVNPSDHGIDTERVEIDRRWAYIKRPTVIVGGELTMDHLEIQTRQGSNVLEAPVQLKSNCGVLVIDDFGRQRISPTDILNRWIVPLERHEDFLNLPNGRQIQVPFLQTLVLSTNLDPTSLVDEAFLRRIPYKVEMPDPTEESFAEVFAKCADSMKMRVEPGAFEYLLEKYRTARIAMRYCHARDLLFQIDNLCDLHGLPRTVTPRTMDAVIRNYFGGVNTL